MDQVVGECREGVGRLVRTEGNGALFPETDPFPVLRVELDAAPAGIQYDPEAVPGLVAMPSDTQAVRSGSVERAMEQFLVAREGLLVNDPRIPLRVLARNKLLPAYL